MRGLGGADRHRAGARSKPPLDGERLPGRGGLVLGEAVRVLAGMPEGGAVLPARTGPADVLESEPHRPSDDGVGPGPGAERTGAARVAGGGGRRGTPSPNPRSRTHAWSRSGSAGASRVSASSPRSPGMGRPG